MVVGAVTAESYYALQGLFARGEKRRAGSRQVVIVGQARRHARGNCASARSGIRCQAPMANGAATENDRVRDDARRVILLRYDASALRRECRIENCPTVMSALREVASRGSREFRCKNVNSTPAIFVFSTVCPTVLTYQTTASDNECKNVHTSEQSRGHRRYEVWGYGYCRSC